jgi:hypothetical protein
LIVSSANYCELQRQQLLQLRKLEDSRPQPRVWWSVRLPVRPWVPFNWMAQLNIGGITVYLYGFDGGVFAVGQRRE